VACSFRTILVLDVVSGAEGPTFSVSSAIKDSDASFAVDLERLQMMVEVLVDLRRKDIHFPIVENEMGNAIVYMIPHEVPTFAVEAAIHDNMFSPNTSILEGIFLITSTLAVHNCIDNEKFCMVS
jgi:hypothetical protein